MTKALQAVKGTLVTDAKSLYDVVKRGDLNSAGAGLKEKYSTLEFLSLLEMLKTGRTAVRWVHSDAQLADALTKPLASTAPSRPRAAECRRAAWSAAM